MTQIAVESNILNESIIPKILLKLSAYHTVTHRKFHIIYNECCLDWQPTTFLIVIISELLTVFWKLILSLILLHLFAPPLHPLHLCLQQFQKPASVLRTHGPWHPTRIFLIHGSIHPGVWRGQNGGIKAHVGEVILDTGMVVVPRALDADSRSGWISGRLADNGPLVGLCELVVTKTLQKVKISLNGSGDAVGACNSAVAGKERWTMLYSLCSNCWPKYGEKK